MNKSGPLGRICAIALLFFLFLQSGCATSRIDWNGRIGNYTYDQAVLELGPPDKHETLSDGTKVADWLMQRGYSRGGFASYHGPFIHQMMDPPSPDRYLRLLFDPEGRLQSWRQVNK